jgi:hypothetical protein
VDDLRLEAGKLNKHWERGVHDQYSTLTGLTPMAHAIASGARRSAPTC